MKTDKDETYNNNRDIDDVWPPRWVATIVVMALFLAAVIAAIIFILMWLD
jgi:hypothetical protein